MSRHSRTDVYYRMWMSFDDDSPRTEEQLRKVAEQLEEAARQVLAPHGITLYAREFQAKDGRVVLKGERDDPLRVGISRKRDGQG